MPDSRATSGRDSPLYINKVPNEIQDYLNKIKEETGITKSDAVTLILEVANKFITPEQISHLYDQYLLFGRDGIEKNF